MANILWYDTFSRYKDEEGGFYTYAHKPNEYVYYSNSSSFVWKSFPERSKDVLVIQDVTNSTGPRWSINTVPDIAVLAFNFLHNGSPYRFVWSNNGYNLKQSNISSSYSDTRNFSMRAMPSNLNSWFTLCQMGNIGVQACLYPYVINHIYKFRVCYFYPENTNVPLLESTIEFLLPPYTKYFAELKVDHVTHNIKFRINGQVLVDYTIVNEDALADINNKFSICDGRTTNPVTPTLVPIEISNLMILDDFASSSHVILKSLSFDETRRTQPVSEFRAREIDNRANIVYGSYAPAGTTVNDSVFMNTDVKGSEAVVGVTSKQVDMDGAEDIRIIMNSGIDGTIPGAKKRVHILETAPNINNPTGEPYIPVRIESEETNIPEDYTRIQTIFTKNLDDEDWTPETIPSAQIGIKIK